MKKFSELVEYYQKNKENPNCIAEMHRLVDPNSSKIFEEIQQKLPILLAKLNQLSNILHKENNK